MKITHNKIGQNLNLTDSTAADRANTLKNKSSASVDAKTDSLMKSNIGDSSRVELSPKAQDAKRIKELAMAAPDVDAVKVAKFRSLIDEGKYSVDAKAIADKMVDEHLEF